MKAFIYGLLFTGAASNACAQNSSNIDSTGNPGDHLDLQGVMTLFKSAKDLEDFEKALNTESNQVNNLDLNKDGETDYIKVIDRADSNAHAIVLQVAVSETESQDVAVIEVEKTDDEFASLQIVGDDDVYGKDYIYEPFENYVNQDQYNQQNNTTPTNSSSKTKVVVNVWAWPTVRVIYGPSYRPWVSPWYWRHYPGWWRPWHPVAWHVHHKRVVRYHLHYHRVYVHRVQVAHRVYHRNRVYSPTVRKTHVIHHTGPVVKTKQSHNRSQRGSRNPKPRTQQKQSHQPKHSPKSGNKGSGNRRH